MDHSNRDMAYQQHYPFGGEYLYKENSYHHML